MSHSFFILNRLQGYVIGTTELFFSNIFCPVDVISTIAKENLKKLETFFYPKNNFLLFELFKTNKSLKKMKYYFFRCSVIFKRCFKEIIVD